MRPGPFRTARPQIADCGGVAFSPGAEDRASVRWQPLRCTQTPHFRLLRLISCRKRAVWCCPPKNLSLPTWGLSADSAKAPLSVVENDTKLPVCDGKPAMPGGNGEFGVTGCSCPATRSSFLRCTAFLANLAALPRRLPDRARLVPSVFPTDLASSRPPSRPSSPRLARRQLPAAPPPLELRRPSPQRLPSRIHRGLRGISSSLSLPSLRPPTD